MPRIRSIKPEFPHSESMGNVSRDARLTFIELWTVADDEGRLRGDGRLLASLLFPYDTDARDLMGGWLDELEREKCIHQYRVGGAHYVQVMQWTQHQKIDHPTASRLPAPQAFANPRELSRILAIPRAGLDRRGEERIGGDLSTTGVVDGVFVKTPADPAANEKSHEHPETGSAATCGVPDCPHKRVLALWAEVMPDLPQHTKWTATRCDHLRARWRETAVEKHWHDLDEGVAYMRKLFGWIRQSDFLMGRAKPSQRDRRPFQLELDWLIRPTNWAKVHEGKYHQEEAA